MLVTQQPIFRKFWHAVMPLSELADGPNPFTLLGENIVVFLDAQGRPAALRDRCCHRTARLSKGWCVDSQGKACKQATSSAATTAGPMRPPGKSSTSRGLKQAAPSCRTTKPPLTTRLHAMAMRGWRLKSRSLTFPMCPNLPTRPTAPSFSFMSAGKPARCARWKIRLTTRTSVLCTAPLLELPPASSPASMSW